MATRSTIALEFADGTVEQVYCHWDGYLSGNGRILQDHYMDPFKVKALIGLGSISSLGAEIGEKQDFNDRTTQKDEWTLSYHRDRGEELCVNKFKDMVDYESNCQREEYNYILRNVNGKATWFVEYFACEGGWITLEEAFLMDKEMA